MSWPKQLVHDLLKRRVVIVLGAGISAQSLSNDGQLRPPTWKAFLENGIDRVGNVGTRHIRAAVNSGDYLRACEWLKRRMDEDWIPFLTETFVHPQFHAAEIHDIIFRLDQRIVLTPNFDDIYERFAVSQSHGQIRVKSYFEEDAALFLRSDEYFVIKIHGNINTPNKLIFTESEYAKTRNKYGSFYASLDAAILSHTFLFIGCSTSDPDIALLLENNNFRFPGMPPHYFVTASKMNTDLEKSLRDSRNLKCIRYQYSEDHSELLVKLKELQKALEEESRGDS